MSEDLLKELVQEVRLLREEMRGQSHTTCEAKEAVGYIGVTNVRYLTHFANEGLLNRRKGGRGFVYYKTELMRLADMLRNGETTLPRLNP